MSSKQTLAEIKKVEAEAQEILEKARKKAAEILEQAKISAQEKIKKEEKILFQKKEEILERARQEAQSATQNILTQNKKEILSLEAQAKENTLKAASFVLDQILLYRNFNKLKFLYNGKGVGENSSFPRWGDSEQA